VRCRFDVIIIFAIFVVLTVAIVAIPTVAATSNTVSVFAYLRFIAVSFDTDGS